MKVNRLAVYRHKNKNDGELIENITERVISIFINSKEIYGSRNIRKVLLNEGIRVSIQKIRKIMKKNGLFSSYTIAQYKPKLKHNKVNREQIDNKLNRQFDCRNKYEVIVSDLTYVRVKCKWNYICLLTDLFNREIVGFSISQKKDANLVLQAFYNSNIPLNRIKLFHTDRGTEFKNTKIEELLRAFNIERSLSNPGNPYDNAVAERLYSTLKIEFIRKRNFNSLEQLIDELKVYINWYNNDRQHSKLNYMSPVQYGNVNYESVSKT